MDNRIGSFVRNQFSLFNENFIDSLSENSGDHIHDFRIAAKRIKMIFGFIQIVCKNAGMKTMYRSSGIREAFKAAGRYREISLNRHLLAELGNVIDDKIQYAPE